MLRSAEEAYALDDLRWALFFVHVRPFADVQRGQRIAAQHHPLLDVDVDVRDPRQAASDPPAWRARFGTAAFRDGLPPRFSLKEEAQQPWGPRAAPTDLLYNPIPSSPRHVYDPSAVLNIRTVMAQRIAAHVRAPNLGRRPPTSAATTDRSAFPEDYNATAAAARRLARGRQALPRLFALLERAELHASQASRPRCTSCDHKQREKCMAKSNRAPRTRRAFGD